MTKEEVQKVLEIQLEKLEDKVLEQAIVNNIMEKYREDCTQFQALRYLKKQTDKIWKVVKQLSERSLVGERAKELKRVLNQIKPKSISMMRTQKVDPRS